MFLKIVLSSQESRKTGSSVQFCFKQRKFRLVKDSLERILSVSL
jgi:hypothetical protein